MNRQFIEDYLKDVSDLVRGIPPEEIEAVIKALLDCIGRESRIFIIGNGGSAATASHFACDLGKGTRWPGGVLVKAVALTDSVPVMTAWANDISYRNVFCEQLRPLAARGDVLLSISGSGNSENVIEAVLYASSAGVLTVGLTGFDGGLLKKKADISIVVPSGNMQQIEDAHTVLCHLISSYIREHIKYESSVS